MGTPLSLRIRRRGVPVAGHKRFLIGPGLRSIAQGQGSRLAGKRLRRAKPAGRDRPSCGSRFAAHGVLFRRDGEWSSPGTSGMPRPCRSRPAGSARRPPRGCPHAGFCSGQACETRGRALPPAHSTRARSPHRGWAGTDELATARPSRNAAPPARRRTRLHPAPRASSAPPSPPSQRSAKRCRHRRRVPPAAPAWRPYVPSRRFAPSRLPILAAAVDDRCTRLLAWLPRHLRKAAPRHSPSANNECAG